MNFLFFVQKTKTSKLIHTVSDNFSQKGQERILPIEPREGQSHLTNLKIWFQTRLDGSCQFFFLYQNGFYLNFVEPFWDLYSCFKPYKKTAVLSSDLFFVFCLLVFTINFIYPLAPVEVDVPGEFWSTGVNNLVFRARSTGKKKCLAFLCTLGQGGVCDLILHKRFWEIWNMLGTSIDLSKLLCSWSFSLLIQHDRKLSYLSFPDAS